MQINIRMNAPTMRNWMRIAESTTAGFPNVDSAFLVSVRAQVHESWVDELSDDVSLTSAIMDFFAAISRAGWNGGIVVWRADMRPRSIIRSKKFRSVSCFWTWKQEAASVYLEDESLSNLELITLTAYAESNIIDWPKTVARNLTNPDEYEINIRGPKMEIAGFYDQYGEYHGARQVVPVRQIVDEPAPRIAS